MKTALEVLFETTNGDADYISVNNCLEAMKLYRNQGIEQAAEVAKQYLTDGFTVTNKEAILALVEKVRRL